MRLPHVLARSMQRVANSLGYTVTRLDAIDTTMEAALRGIQRRGHGIATVVDIGASDGRWSALAMRYFPASRYLLVEAQGVHEPELRDFCVRHQNADFELVAAGESEGHINFDATHPFSGQASPVPFASNNVVVPVSSVDRLVGTRGLHGPYLLKLDTHGYEVPILNGAKRALAETEAIIMECYNFRISPECLLFHEMCDYIQELGFRCIDLVSPQHRPLDNSFWQMDLVFVKATRKEFEASWYS